MTPIADRPESARSPLGRALCAAGALGLALGCSAPLPADDASAPRPERESLVGSAESPVLDALIEGFEEQAEALRELRFRRPVDVRPLVRAEIADSLRREIEEMLPPAQHDAYRDAYVALGVLPPEIDLIEVFAAIYGAQMVGRYSRREAALYLLESDSPIGYARSTVAVHELVHALQDQHFPHAMALAETLRHNDDLVSTLVGVIEGDASFSMFGADDGDPDTSRTQETAERFRRDMLRELDAGLGPLGRAPLLIQVGVLFPYAFGTVVAARRYGERGNEGLDALLRDPPLSTLELLYPGDAPRERPAIDFVALPDTLIREELGPRGCRVGHHNVAGSLTLQVLFEEHGESDAGGLDQAWRGDRFLHGRCGDGGHELLWLTRWQDEASAERFAERYTRIAPAIAAHAPLASDLVVLRSGRTVVAATRAWTGLARKAMAQAEIRAYSSFERWYREGCFGEPGGCPREEGASASSLDSAPGMIANR